MTDTIPTEVLELVLKAHFDSRDANQGNSSISPLCVCRKWRDVGMRLLGTDVVLRNPTQIKHFAQASRPHSLQLIQKLTISIPPIDAGYILAMSRLELEGTSTRGRTGTLTLHEGFRDLQRIFR
jgi:hypothetical protein